MDREFDVVVMGASGFTGQRVVEHIAQRYGTSIKWAVAGRNKAKLESTLSAVASRLNVPEVANIPVLVADSHNMDQLDAMTSRTRVVASTTGPFLRHGSDLVASCVKNGTSYCDSTGESVWAADMYKKHNEEAKAKGIRIVPMCGLDCVPADLGTYLATKELKKAGVECERVDSYIVKMKGGASGGTFNTMLTFLEEMYNSDKATRAEMGSPYVLVPAAERSEQSQPSLYPVEFSKDINSYTQFFPLSSVNAQTVHWSNYSSNWAYGKQLQYKEKKRAKSYWKATFETLVLATITFLGFLPFTRNILRKVLPQPGTGPSEEEMKNGRFLLKVFAKGPAIDNQEPTTRVVNFQIDEGPGYSGTGRMVAEAALTMALNPDLSTPTGVLPTAVALGDTFVERLNQLDTFSIGPDSA
eukprot:m.174970 g.174970  ORF g.174970 m.174970 type:complete len:413 (+) comp14602_c0_seq1:368-1606(+)